MDFPEGVAGFRSLLRMLNHLVRFLHIISYVMVPILVLLNKITNWTMQREQKAASVKIKQLMAPDMCVIKCVAIRHTPPLLLQMRVHSDFARLCRENAEQRLLPQSPLIKT